MSLDHRVPDLERRVRELEAEVKLLRRAAITEDTTVLRAPRHVDAGFVGVRAAPDALTDDTTKPPDAFARFNADFMGREAVDPFNGDAPTTRAFPNKAQAEAIAAMTKAERHDRVLKAARAEREREEREDAHLALDLKGVPRVAFGRDLSLAERMTKAERAGDCGMPWRGTECTHPQPCACAKETAEADRSAEHARVAYYAEERGQDVTHLCPRDPEDDMA